mmetsp:Transcript_6889/g.42035  ORF Transcript_6889/g.42035 Transcript_6889/m.42035 type:complete len:331 (+) Transcript_6889:306-1298(+)
MRCARSSLRPRAKLLCRLTCSASFDAFFASIFCFCSSSRRKHQGQEPCQRRSHIRRRRHNRGPCPSLGRLSWPAYFAQTCSIHVRAEESRSNLSARRWKSCFLQEGFGSAHVSQRRRPHRSRRRRRNPARRPRNGEARARKTLPRLRARRERPCALCIDGQAHVVRTCNVDPFEWHKVVYVRPQVYVQSLQSEQWHALPSSSTGRKILLAKCIDASRTDGCVRGVRSTSNKPLEVSDEFRTNLGVPMHLSLRAARYRPTFSSCVRGHAALTSSFRLANLSRAFRRDSRVASAISQSSSCSSPSSAPGSFGASTVRSSTMPPLFGLWYSLG